MCNCGCDTSTKDAADKLKRQAVVSASSVAALAGIPAVLNAPGHPHHQVMYAVIAVQAALIANAFRLIYKRKQLLQGA
jgi:hypothetical protein